MTKYLIIFFKFTYSVELWQYINCEYILSREAVPQTSHAAQTANKYEVKRQVHFGSCNWNTIYRAKRLTIYLKKNSHASFTTNSRTKSRYQPNTLRLPGPERPLPDAFSREPNKHPAHRKTATTPAGGRRRATPGRRRAARASGDTERAERARERPAGSAGAVHTCYTLWLLPYGRELSGRQLRRSGRHSATQNSADRQSAARSRRRERTAQTDRREHRTGYRLPTLGQSIPAGISPSHNGVSSESREVECKHNK